MKQKQTAPWVAMDASWWPTIAAEMVLPWTRAAVLMDLRWWADQERMERAKRPGRPALSRRWGWKEKKARLVLKAEDEWRSPSKAENKKGQPRASEGQAEGQDSAPKPTESQHPGASRGPAEGQRGAPRVDLQKTKAEAQRINSSREERPYRIDEVWRDIDQIRKKHHHYTRRLLKLTKPRRAALKARLEEYGTAEVLRVVEWRESSPHKRAQFLRDGGHGIDTLLRASNFTQYLECSYEDQTPVTRSSNGLLTPMDALRKARQSRQLKEATASALTVVQFPHPQPTPDDF